MSAPVRIQRKRAKGWKMPADTVVVDRSSVWGNPFVAGDREHLGIPYAGGPLTAAEAVVLFRAYARSRQMDFPGTFEPLRGKNLACWCRLDQPCHADVLLELANAESSP